MKKRYEYIDALRGFAVFGVFVVHVFNPIIGKMSKFWAHFAANGARGVQLFFIISALTLFMSLDRRSDEHNKTLNFFIRRFFRIAPLFYLAIVAYLFMNGMGPRYWLGDAPRITTWNIAATALFINGWYPYWINSVIGINWTIAVEASFYLLVPFLFLKIKNLANAILVFLLSVISMQFINAYLSSHSLVSNNELWQNFLFLWLPAQFPVFMMGIILFHLIYGKKEGLFTTKTQLNVLFFLFFFLTVELLYFDQLPAINGYAVAYALLIFVLASHPFKLFVNSFWIYLGKISYSAYLIHFAVIDFAVKLQSSLNLGFKLHIYQRYLVVLVLTVVITIDPLLNKKLPS